MNLERAIELWDSVCAEFIATVSAVKLADSTRPTALDWNVRQIVQHVVHIESALLALPIQGTDSYSFDSTTTYIENGAASLSHLDFAALLSALRTAHDARIAYLDRYPLPPHERDHWTEVATDRIIDLWVHRSDILTALGKPVSYDGPSSAVVLDSLVSGLAKVQRRLTRQTEIGQVAVHVPVPHHPTTTVRRSLYVGHPSTTADRGAHAEVVLDADSFVRLSTGRVASNRYKDRLSGNKKLGEAFLRSANQFTASQGRHAP